jgi:ATP-binding cassette subfamily C (CFTR/MRP) protein 1
MKRQASKLPYQSLQISPQHPNHTSLDHASDLVIQRLLRQNFPSHTIIVVAHRLDSILDFDKVVVMSKGALVEYGEPHKLLEQPGSWFKGLYEEVSKGEAIDEGDDNSAQSTL